MSMGLPAFGHTPCVCLFKTANQIGMENRKTILHPFIFPSLSA